MSIAYVIDEIFEAHAPPRAHPERPERLRHTRERLRETELENRGERVAARDVDDNELGRVHVPAYIADLEKVMANRSDGWLDEDTYYSADSWRAARMAAAAAVDVTRAVLDGRSPRGLALVRPPGHHAEADRAMGFCLFNNVAIAAAAAIEHGATRVAVLDFDVHHGNGTQHMFESDPSVLFMSAHQYPYYPGSGSPDEVGVGAGTGTTVNVGLPSGCNDDDYDAVFTRVFGPALAGFKPDILLVSAGFDAAAADPLAQMEVSEAGYRRIAQRICQLAERYSGGRLAAVLEGGYDLESLAGGVCAMVETMLEASPNPALSQTDPSAGASAAIEATLSAHSGSAGSLLGEPR